jgi:ribonuclease H2 subunit C
LEVVSAPSSRDWLTITGKKRTSYFRGRKLHGKSIRVPGGYKGVVLSTATAKIPIEPQDSQDSEYEDEPTLEVGIMKERAEFDELVVCGHESLPDDSADAYVRGMEEWIVFSEFVSRLAQY